MVMKVKLENSGKALGIVLHVIKFSGNRYY